MTPLLQRTAWAALVLLACASTARAAEPLFRCAKGRGFNACFTKAMLKVVDKLSTGDPANRIPRMDPLLVPVMPVSNHNGNALNMNLTFYNMRISEITHGVTIQSVKFDHDALDLDIRFYRPHVNFKGNYKASGKILWLPVWGSGPFSMQMSDVYERYHIKAERKKGIDGRVYMHILDYTSTLEPKAMTLSFDNLFNGNWVLGKGANSLINAQWETLYAEIAPLTNKHFSIIMKPYWEDILSRDPLDVMFPAASRLLDEED